MTEGNNKENMGMGTWMAFTLFRNLTRLNPWLHLERLTVLQLVEKVPAVYEN